MGKKANQICDDLHEGYQALGPVIVMDRGIRDDDYEMGYLDGWCNAMMAADESADGNRSSAKDAFPFLLNEKIREKARRRLKENLDG